jgi:hypothetical protein
LTGADADRLEGRAPGGRLDAAPLDPVDTVGGNVHDLDAPRRSRRLFRSRDRRRPERDAGRHEGALDDAPVPDHDGDADLVESAGRERLDDDLRPDRGRVSERDGDDGTGERHRIRFRGDDPMPMPGWLLPVPQR